jgi:hypothetical protein
MEVFALLTPIYSGNSKLNLESCLVESVCDTPGRIFQPTLPLGEEASAWGRLCELGIKGPELGA